MIHALGTADPAFVRARVAAEIGEGRYLLADGRCARQALSCLLVPQAGDQVLLAECGADERYVLHVLAREPAGEARLSVPGAASLAIHQGRVEICAVELAALRSLRDVELTAAAGTLCLNARNLFSTVTDSIVESARHYVGRVGHYFLEAKALLRLHGAQALITAEKEVKVDAERISMG